MLGLAYIVTIILLWYFVRSNELLVWGIVLALQEMTFTSIYEVYKWQMDEFPEEMYGHPKCFTFLFRHVHFDVDHVPKLAILHMYLSIGLKIITNVLFILIVVMVPMESRIGLMIVSALGIAMLDVLVEFFFIGWSTKVCFFHKFKKITKSNIRYMVRRLSFVNTIEKEPRVIYCGKCCITSRRIIKNQEIATVTLIKSRKVLDGILLTGNKEYKSGEVYKVYEICGVKYID